MSIFEDNNRIVANYSFSWTINEFTSKAANEIIISPSFYVGVNELVEWNLQIHPNGGRIESKGYLSLFLHLVSSYEPIVSVKFNIFILDAKNVKVNEKKSEIIKFFQGQSRWGWDKFLARDNLLNKTNFFLTNDDKLTIVCDITVFGSNKSKAFKFQTSDHLYQILNTKKFSDLTLVAGKKKFQVHKAILAARSPIFLSMFDKMESHQNQITITDVKPHVLEAMLNFIYSDKVPNLNVLAEDLLAAADKYQLERLKLMCEEMLCSTLTIESAAKILVLADLHNGGQFKTEVLKFICMHAKDVGQSEGIKWMASSYPNLIVEIFQTLAVKNLSETD